MGVRAAGRIRTCPAGVSGSVRSTGHLAGISACVDAFTAVVTTGIYCQPACSARPRAENTRTYPLAAAAEAAGYRACLRCRPYRYPQTIEWEAPEFVCRGVRLILEGALDRGSEDDLARRLGISARHLRRLFSAHLGVTPDGLARSARAHFARRLLDDTDLSVTEIAFASGFGSLRQFNRACRGVFRDTPRGLRARRRKADRLVADGGLPLRLSFVGQLDWPALLDYFASRAIAGVECVDATTCCYARTCLAGASWCTSCSAPAPSPISTSASSSRSGCSRRIRCSGGCFADDQVFDRREPGTASRPACGRSWGSRPRWWARTG